MKKQVLINIQGVYSYDDQDEDEIIELFTTGMYEKDGDSYIISYDESDATGFEGSSTTLSVEKENCVTLVRRGAANTHLVIQNGVRHQGFYDLGYGDMLIGVNGVYIESDLNEFGGKLKLRYSLDVDSIFTSQNTMAIDIKESEPSAM